MSYIEGYKRTRLLEVSILPALHPDWLIHRKPVMRMDASPSTVMRIDANQSKSSPVVLKLGTAVPLGSAKQFQGDGFLINHPIELWLIGHLRT